MSGAGAREQFVFQQAMKITHDVEEEASERGKVDEAPSRDEVDEGVMNDEEVDEVTTGTDELAPSEELEEGIRVV